MLMNILKNCFIVRAYDHIAENAHSWYTFSVLGRINAFLSSHYASSNTKKLFDRFVNRNSSVYTSFYAAILVWFSTLAAKFGDFFMPLFRNSLIYRFLCSLGHFLIKIWNGSILGRIFSRLNIHFKQFIIILAALYLPLDYIIRNYISISILSSLWDELLFFAAVAYIICRKISGRQPQSPNGECSRASALDIPILFFCAVGFALMCFNSPDMSIAIDGYRATIQYMLWFFVMLRLLDSEQDAVILELTVALVGLAMALHGIYQYIIAAPIPAGWVSQTEQGVRTRAYSITGSPNILGSYMVMTAPIFAGLAYRFRSMKAKLLMWSAVMLECVCLLVTFSRGAWVGMVVAVVVFALILDKRLLGLLVFAATAALMVPQVSSRILYLFTDDFAQASAVGGRSLRWSFGYSTMRANPILGFGLGRFGGAVAMQNQILEETDAFSYFYMDNYYLKIGTEMGYTGLIAFLILVVALVILGFRALMRIKHERSSYFPVAVGIYSGLCGVLVHCYFENIFEVPYMMGLFWSLAAALFVFNGTGKGNKNGQQT